MSEQVNSQGKKTSKVGALATGAGGGTLLLAIANTLSDDNPWKHTLMMIAPSISVTLGFLWLHIQVLMVNYMQDRRIKRLAKRAKERLLEALENPNTSEEHQAIIRKKMEQLELHLADRELKQILSIKAVTAADITKPKSVTATDVSGPKTPVVAIDKPKSNSVAKVNKTESTIVDIDKPKSTNTHDDSKLKRLAKWLRLK